MKKDTKYRLIRTVSELLIITTLATGISHTAAHIKYPQEVIPYTQEDSIKNLTFNEELSNLIPFLSCTVVCIFVLEVLNVL